jgi:predicted TIM-barrel fold metal-dependent hydrolase
MAQISSNADIDPLQGIQFVDCDAHITEPLDLWTSRAPSSWLGRVPELRTINGQSGWYLHDELWSRIGGNTIASNGEKVLGTLTLQPFSELSPASWSVKERLELLDEMGIAAQILYPNGIGFASNHIFAIDDEEERAVILQIYNDFLVEVQEESDERLLPQALLPVWDMDFTIREMTRLIDNGIRGFTISDKPELLGLPELPDSYFDPMWDLFNESSAVVNFHIASGLGREELEAMRVAMSSENPTDGSGRALKSGTVASPSWGKLGPQRKMAVFSAQSQMSNVRIVVNLCMSDIFDRYPKLKVVSAESGIGWVPFILETMDFQYDEMVTSKDEVSPGGRHPSEYFRDHLYVMFWFESVAPQKLIHDIGVKNILVETDVPHPTCLYPNTRAHFARVLADVGPSARQRILRDNAIELYRLNL